jgi:hypothetical protein
LANGKSPPVLSISEKPLLKVELLSEARRTTLADFFSILLVVRAYEGESIVSRRVEKRSAGQLY